MYDQSKIMSQYMNADEEEEGRPSRAKNPNRALNGHMAPSNPPLQVIEPV